MKISQKISLLKLLTEYSQTTKYPLGKYPPQILSFKMFFLGKNLAWKFFRSFPQKEKTSILIVFLSFKTCGWEMYFFYSWWTFRRRFSEEITFDNKPVTLLTTKKYIVVIFLYFQKLFEHEIFFQLCFVYKIQTSKLPWILSKLFRIKIKTLKTWVFANYLLYKVCLETK